MSSTIPKVPDWSRSDDVTLGIRQARAKGGHHFLLKISQSLQFHMEYRNARTAASPTSTRSRRPIGRANPPPVVPHINGNYSVPTFLGSKTSTLNHLTWLGAYRINASAASGIGPALDGPTHLLMPTLAELSALQGRYLTGTPAGRISDLEVWIAPASQRLSFEAAVPTVCGRIESRSEPQIQVRQHPPKMFRASV